MKDEQLQRMKTASHLLPDPGGKVVRELIAEIEQLQIKYNGRLAELRQTQADYERLRKELTTRDKEPDLQEVWESVRKSRQKTS